MLARAADIEATLQGFFVGNLEAAASPATGCRSQRRGHRPQIRGIVAVLDAFQTVAQPGLAAVATQGAGKLTAIAFTRLVLAEAHGVTAVTVTVMGLSVPVKPSKLKRLYVPTGSLESSGDDGKALSKKISTTSSSISYLDMVGA